MARGGWSTRAPEGRDPGGPRPGDPGASRTRTTWFWLAALVLLPGGAVLPAVYGWVAASHVVGEGVQATVVVALVLCALVFVLLRALTPPTLAPRDRVRRALIGTLIAAIAFLPWATLAVWYWMRDCPDGRCFN